MIVVEAISAPLALLQIEPNGLAQLWKSIANECRQDASIITLRVNMPSVTVKVNG